MTFTRYILLAFVVLSGVGVTAASTYYLFITEHKERAEQFSHQTIPYFGAISSNFHKSLDQIEATQAYIQSATSVSREQFSSFVSILVKDSPGIQAIEWIPRVLHSKRASIESAAQFHGYSDFKFLEKSDEGKMIKAKDRLEYYPVYYIEPFIENIKAFGFDLASNETRKKALIESRDSGEVVLTRRITLVQETGKQYGILAFQPVYRRDLPSKTTNDRKDSIKGFVLGVFRISDIVNQALMELPALEQTQIHLFDRSLPNQKQVLFESQLSGTQHNSETDDKLDTVSYRFELPDKSSQWELVFTHLHPKNFLASNDITWFTLVAGLIMTSMITVIVLVYMNRATVTAKLVEERTIELKISEEKAIQMAAEAENSQREAEIANSAKSNFLATMSHEIRTPLNGLLGMAQLLKNSPLNADQEKQAETILSSGQTLLAIINDVLDMSKIEAGGIELEVTAFSLRNLFSSVSTPFQSLADDKGIKLSVSDQTQNVDALRGDPVRLRQIIWNLLSNAIKFTHEGQVAIHFSITDAPSSTEAKDKDTAICITVSDTGVGISEDRLPYIFDAFTQEDTSTTRKFGGSGLGLSIVKKLVDLMGGTLTAKSEPGEGTCFTVVLPFDQASEQERNQLIQNKRNVSADDKRPRLRVLVAEDNAVNAIIAEAFLTQFGHRVVVAENGLEAVAAMSENDFDLILMDIHMPEMNGIDATKAIRKTDAGAHIPIIGLTAEAFAERHLQFKNAGMNDVLTKPFTENQLRDILARYGDHNGTTSAGQNEQTEELAQGSNIENNDFPIGDTDKLASFRQMFPEDKIRELLLEVHASIETRMEEIRTALQENDLTMLKAAAHSIAGMSGSMFGIRLFEQAKTIETEADDLDAVRNLVPALEKTAEETRTWWLKESNS